MKKTWVIWKKETLGYARSPLPYVLFALVFAVTAIFFMVIAYGQKTASTQWIPGIFSFLLLFVTPLVTMRLVAEENSQGTLELLLTSPVRESEVVLGKLLGALTLYLALFALSLVFPLVLFFFGTPEKGPLLAQYVGLVLVSCSFVSVGLFASSITKNQVIAAVAGYMLLFWFWVSGFIGQADFMTGKLGTVLQATSLEGHLQSFEKGVIDAKDVFAYLAFIAIFTLLALFLMEARRWGEFAKATKLLVKAGALVAGGAVGALVAYLAIPETNKYATAIPLGLLAAGLVGAIAIAVMDLQGADSQVKQRLAYGGNALLMTVGVIGIATVGYVLVDRWRPFQWDLTKEGLYSLAPKTVEILKKVDQDVSVTYVKVPRSQDDPGADYDNQKVKDELDQFAAHSHGHLKVEQLDPYIDEMKVMALGADRGEVVFQQGDKKVMVAQRDIFQAAAGQMGDDMEESVYHKFNGEAAFDGALLKLQSGGGSEVACFLTGHGESSIDSEKVDGFKAAQELLGQENMSSKTVSLLSAAAAPAASAAATPAAPDKPVTIGKDSGATGDVKVQDVPSDCSVLVEAGPQVPLAQAEVAAIQKFWAAGHGLVVLLDPLSPANDSLQPVLAKLGVAPLPGVAMDPKAIVDSPLSIGIVPTAAHEIVLDMAGHGEIAVFPRAVGLSVAGNLDSSLKDTVLIETSRAGRELVDIKGGAADPNDPKNVKGPITLGVAIERTQSGDTTKVTRAVVLGSTSFAWNGGLEKYGGGNVDLLKNSVHFASGAEDKIGIAAKEPNPNSITMSLGSALWILFMTALVVPSGIFGGGIAVWLRRKHR